MYRLIAITTLTVSAAFAAPVGAAEQGGGGAMHPDSRADDAGKRPREALAQHLKISKSALATIAHRKDQLSSRSQSRGRRKSS
jgi:hypothetical protein